MGGRQCGLAHPLILGRTTPGNRASLRRGCGRYGGLGRSITGRFEGAGLNTAASRGPKAAGSGIAKGERAQEGSQGRTGPASSVFKGVVGDAVVVTV